MDNIIQESSEKIENIDTQDTLKEQLKRNREKLKREMERKKL